MLIARREAGLPCEDCGTPTGMSLFIIDACPRCSFTVKKPPDHGKPEADPRYGPYCNP